MLPAILFISFMNTSALHAQPQTALPMLDSLDALLTRYAAAHRPADLFLHCDKTIYVPNENIWFTAYIFDDDTAFNHHTLHTVLIEESSKKIVASQRFVINDRLGAGSIFLPDSLRVGEYRLLAYTNSFFSRQGQVVFNQSISLRSTQSTPFKVSMLPATAGKDSVYASWKVLTGYGGLASGGEVNYTLMRDGVEWKKGKQPINAFGEMSFAFANDEVLSKKIQLQATITKVNTISSKKETQSFNLDIPLFEKTAFIKLYPEGGNLIHDHPSLTAIEIRNGWGKPVATRGELLEDGKPLASFSTSEFGTGIFRWQPAREKKYTIKLPDNSLTPDVSIPPIANEGYSMEVQGAIIEDTSFVLKVTAQPNSNFYLLMHNYRAVFFAVDLHSSKKQTAFRLPASDLPEGVVTLTLFDEAGTPQAERAIYVRKSLPLQVSLSADSGVYHHRSKLRLKVKVTNENGEPVESVFSLACVLASRLDSTRSIDITRFYSFDRYLPQLASLPTGDYFHSNQNIHHLLLTRFWTRYKWEEIKKDIAAPVSTEKICETGVVYFRDSRIKKPVKLIVLNDGGFSLVETDASGKFQLPPDVLRAPPGGKVMVTVQDNNNAKYYSIRITDNCAPADSGLSKIKYPDFEYIKAELPPEEVQAVKATTLKQVVVTAKKQEDIYYSDQFKSKDCNDWVCMNNILNCPNHRSGTKPISGHVYNFMGKNVTYQDCNDKEESQFVSPLTGINYPKEFYVADYVQFNPPDPELLSTVFWSYALVTDEKGEAGINFSTNDLNGRFVCVLQGFSAGGVISAKTFFRVVD